MLQRITHWFAKGVIEDRRDEIWQRNHEASKQLIGISFFTLLAFQSPLPIKIAAIAWPAIGLLVLYVRLGQEARHFNSSRWTEFLIGWKLWAEMVMEVYLWPFFLLLNMIGSRDTHSYRSTLRSIRIDALFQKLGRVDHAFHSAMECFEDEVLTATEQGHAIGELPEQVALKAKTGAVCGATVMTMATSAASAASPVPVTPTNNVNVSASGWVTAVGNIPIADKPEPMLEYARLFVNVSDDALHTSFFTELALDAFQTPRDPDVLTRHFLSVQLDDRTTVHLGRMYVAGGWIGAPGPTGLETVDYMRFPFTFAANAVQVEMTRGPWHFLADVSGRSSLSFLSGGQFDHVETSGHLSRSFGSTELGLTWQVSEQFARVAVTGSANPLPWLTTRGMFYYDHELSSGHGTTSIGWYGFANIQPFSSVSWLTFHGQADCKVGLDFPEPEPLRITGGIRMKFGTRHSLITDYRAGFGSRHAGDSDGVRMAWQTTF